VSLALYETRVYFDGHRGCVKVPARNGLLGIETRISNPPHIPGLPKLHTIDYAPSAQCTELQAHCGLRREMTSEELRAIDAWLAEYQGADI
jgi:hypothetical protein